MKPAGSPRFLAMVILLSAAAPATGTGEPVSPAEKVAWFASHAAAIRTIDPKDRDFTDLGPLRQAIGDARVVLLGGSSDEAQVKVRYRLVRFLHEEMGFDVLTCDLPLFDAEEFDRPLDRGKAPPFDLEIWNQQAFHYFTYPRRSYKDLDILSYIRGTHKTSRPLHLSGFGLAVSPYMVLEYARTLAQFLESVAPHLATAADRKAIQSLVQLSGPVRFFPVATKEWDKTLPPALKSMARLYGGLGKLSANRPDAGEIVYYRQTIDDLAYIASLTAHRLPAQSPPDAAVVMAKVWRPNSKVVVWSSNWTVGRNWRPVRRPGGRAPLATQSTGVELTHAFGRGVYAIACSEIKNDNGVLQVLQAGEEPKLAAVDGDLESLLHAAGKPISFVDFRGVPADHWLRTPLSARFLRGADTDIWPNHFDGLITVDLPAAKDARERK